MKDFLSYLPLIIISALIIYFFYPYLIAIAIVLLIVCFHREFLGLCALAQIIAVVIGIPYFFFTDSQARNSMLTLALFFGGIFLLAHLSERNEKNKESNENNSSVIQSEQVNRREKIESELKPNSTPNVRSYYNDTAVRNNKVRSETVRQPAEVPTEFYRVDELQSRF